MVEGVNVGGPAHRLRIKGRWQSVVRFFSISVAFMVLWILVTSQLGHYSKLFGPQILLQLNLAFYLPSIPVLLLSGSLERALDARLGPTTSLVLRLNTGLVGCLALAALFPLLPGLRPGDGPLWPLLAAVGVLGGASAVAFSTAYQLVQYFRAADTIGLGVGCVGAGPLVLLVQLALEVGPSPARWQWIAMYEISAGLIAAGLLSSSSLCGQYWNRLNEAAAKGGAGGAAEAAEGRVPLLAAAADADAAAAVAAAAADPESGSRDLQLRGSASGVSGGYGSPGSPYVLRPLSSGGASRRPSRGARPGGVLPRRGPTTAPDPFNIFSLLTPGLDGGFGPTLDDDDDDADAAPPVLLRRSASVGVEDSSSVRAAAAARRRREALAAVGLDRSAHSRTRFAAGAGSATLYSRYAVALPNVKPDTPPPSPLPPLAAGPPHLATVAVAAGPTQTATLLGMVSAPAKMVRHPPAGGGGDGGFKAHAEDDAAIAIPGVLEFGVPDDGPVVQAQSAADDVGASASSFAAVHQCRPSYGASASSFASATASQLLTKALGLGDPEPERTGSIASELSLAAASPTGVAVVAGGGDGLLPQLDSLEVAVVTVAEGPEGKAVEEEEEEEVEAPLTLQQEVLEVLRGSWQVMLGFTVDVTLLYTVFPFFTYVPPSGWLGDNLPQVLFYSRLFTDLAGRLLPRRRALQLRSGTAILALAAASTAAAALFFGYILAPPSLVARAPRLLRNDAVPLGLVVFLWLSGGYTNTMSNMLAPSMVAPSLAGRASALMALTFNVAHIGGLIIAAAMAAAIFGDVVG